MYITEIMAMMINNPNNLSTYDYFLPEKLIAQNPIDKRDESKMLVFNRKTNNIEHKHFFDIIKYLQSGDVLVLNNTRVLPARIFGYKNTGAKVEVLLLKRHGLKIWEVLLKPAKRLHIGEKLVFSDNLSATLLKILDDGNRIIEFEYVGVFESILESIGEMPLPPYIHEKLFDKERYQTVYNKVSGSAAAPTAGLHFTKELINSIQDMGVVITYVTLDVGLGTFRPCKEDDIRNHHIHSEHYTFSKENADIINKAKAENRRVIAVGTTSVRVLETVAKSGFPLSEQHGNTEIYIYPPYEFKVVDALITNFHLPKSTLLMLISAFMGIENALKCYEKAVELEYRFFSFGDSMLIL